MTYHASFLRRNHACQQWSNLIFWDTETLGEPIAGDDQTELHKLRLGVGRSCRRDKGKATRRRVLHYTDNEVFWEWFDSHLDPKRPIYAFAHNIGFDLTISGFWDRLTRGEFLFRLEEDRKPTKENDGTTRIWRGCFCDNDPPTIISVKHAETGCKVTFIDSMNYYRHSLRKIGEKLGVPKLPMPSFDASDEEWFVYCEQDVIVLEEAMMNLMNWFADNDYGNFRMTQASLAMSAFRHRFYKHPICLNSTPFYDELEKESYYGGRLEMFRQGEVAGKTYQLDIVSQYPAVMRINLFPVERVGSSDKTPATLGPDDMGIEYIARVRVKTDTSKYPLRELRKGTIYPTGEFITTLAGPELRGAKQAGDILEVYSWCKYRLAPLFREFVSHFFDKRLEAKERGDEQESYFLKILMNSLYGKFGQQLPEWKDLDGVTDLPKWVQSYLDEEQYGGLVLDACPSAPKFFVHSKADSRDRIKYRTIGTLCQIGQERKPHRNAFCGIASYVTSYARVMIDRLMSIAGREDVYYVVTDAIFCGQAAYDKLRIAGHIRPGNLGKLAIETSGTNARFDALHHYRLGSKSKRGSRKSNALLVCSSCSQPVDDGLVICTKCQSSLDLCTTSEVKFEGIRGVLRRPDKSGVRIGTVKKHWSREYTRGICDDNGKISPLVYGVACDRNFCKTELDHEFEENRYV